MILKCIPYIERKSAVAERFIRTLKTKIYKYMTLESKNVYIDKLDYIVGEYYNTYHRTIKMKQFIKIQFLGHMLLTISMMKKLLEQFMKKNYKRLINKNLG